jgi:hypothetical protein
MLNKYRLKFRTIYNTAALCLRADSVLDRQGGHTLARHTYDAPSFRAILEHNITAKHLALNVWQMDGNSQAVDVACVARLNSKGIQIIKYTPGMWGLHARNLCADTDKEAREFVMQYIANVLT